jgi:GAF domain-containing protein
MAANQGKDEPLQRQIDELTILHAVATAGAEATDEDTLIERATQIIGENLYPDNFGLLILDESRSRLHPHYSYKESPDSRRYQSIGLGEGICGKVAFHGRALRVPDVRQDSDYLEIDPKTRSELCVPLKIGERVIGVINAERVEVDAFTEADERLLSTLAGQLSRCGDAPACRTAFYFIPC